MNHTPTPWHADDAECLGTGMAYIYGSDGSDFAHVPSADAAHIVRCCNMHDELVAALRELMSIHADGLWPVSRVESAYQAAHVVLAKLEAA